MANYYLNDDGSLTTKKNIKGKNYILQENGSLILNNNDEESNKIENNNTFFKKGAFDDGYQFGDVTKTAASTVGDAAVGVGKGIFRLGEGIGDTISYGIADIQELIGNKTAAEKTRERTKESITDVIFKPAEDFVDENSVLGNKSDSVTEGLGYVAGITAISVISGGAGSSLGLSAGTAATIGSTAATFTSSYGHGVTEALNDGATMDEARIYGAISGAAEAGSELMFGGLGKASEAIGLSKGALDDVITSGLTKKIKNRMVKTIVQSGIKAGGEGLEEVVSGLISAAGKKVTYMKDRELKEIIQDENLAEQFWMGVLTSAIAEGPSTLRSIRKGTDYVTGRTNNEQKVYDNEVNERTNLKIKEQTIEQAYNEQIKAQENLGIEVTEGLKQQIMQKIEKAYNNGTLNPIELNKKDILRIQDEVESDMQEGNISSESIMKILGENQDLSKDNLLLRSVYENEQKYNSYQAEQTDNEKVNVLMQSATDAGMNNTKKARKKVELISKLVKDTDRQYKFVSPEQLKQMGYNENANGLIDKANGEILINVHTDKGIQSIIGHETTHIFDSKNSKGEYSKEYQTLQEVAIEYAKTKGIYDSKIKSIIEAYGDLLVDETQVREELTADLVGDFLFNDEKFIENLAVKDRNIFQKLYDYIKHTYKMVKGTDEEKAFENLKHQFEKVYKTISTETDTDTKYSVGGKEGMNNAIKNNTGYLKLERDYNKAQQMQKNGIDNENIRQLTGWFQDKNGDWKFEFSDKYMSLKKNIKLEANKTYKLGNILEHDILFTMYPELANYKVKFEDINASGVFKKNDKTIKINNNKLNLKNSKIAIEGTMIHEIQHAIQNIESFENGKSSKGSKLAYYNKLGEIEADDTKQRFLKEKNGNLDRNNIAPESSKANPKHSKLNKYLENRSVIDKMKDSLYNYINDRISRGDNNDTILEEDYQNVEDEDIQDQNQNTGLVVGGRSIDSSKQYNFIDDGEIANETKNSKENMEQIDEKSSEDLLQNGQLDDRKIWNGLGNRRGRFLNEIDIENVNAESENNSGSFNLLKLEDRISGDKLLNTQDFIEEIKSVGAEVDNNGYVTVYHQTTADNANKIKESGKMLAKEDGIFFSTSKDAQQSEGRGNVKLEFKIPAEMLELDDIFIDNADVKIPLKNQKQVIDIGTYLVNKNELDIDINQKYSMTNDTEITGDDIATKDLLKQEKNTLNEEVGSYADNNSKKTLDMSDLQEYLDERHIDYSIDEEGNIIDIEDESAIQDYLNDKDTIKEDNTKNKKSVYKELQQKYKQMEIGKREYEKLLRREKPTEVEKITVDRLLKGEIEDNEIPASANRQRVVDLYNAKAKFYNVEQEIKKQRKEIANSYRNLAKDMTQNIFQWKDKKRGIQYQVNTMKRNLRDIIPNKSEAYAVYNEYFRPITKNNAIIEKEINKYNDKISKFDINNTESQYIQMIGENRYNPDSKLPLEKIEEFYDNNKNKIDLNKCQEAVEEFRNIYDELIVKVNDTLIENGYKPIEYREGYFPHFIEDKAETMLGKFAEKLGWKVNKDTLPTDIAGITDQFKPGKSWTSFSQQRRGDSTDYNALKGYDNYIRGAMDVIYHTEDIQKLRALENEIRYQYSEKGVKEKIDSIYNDNEISIEEKQQQINETFENIKNNPMGNFATELRSYTDNLANKKSRGDRSMEQSWGRQTYSIMTNIQNRVSANMVGANISSALTNFIPITQAWSQTSTKNIMKAMKESIAIQFNDDGFGENSTFLTNRTEQADRLYKTGLDKVNDKLGYMFDVVDSFTSNVIVRAKYYDNIDAGMSINEAIDNADEFAKDVMAGRSKGDMPTLFNKKNPVAKLFTAFQLEVNNQYGYMLKDLPVDLSGEAKEKLVGAFVKMFLGAYLYNILSEKITGRKSAFSPIDIAIDSYKTATNDELSSGEKIVSIGEDIVGELPFIGGIAGGGRLSIQGAIPYDDPVSMVSDTITNLSDVFDGDNDSKKTAIKSLLKEWSRPLYYVALPFAGGQLKKSAEGVFMYLNDVPGSYANNGDLRFTIDDDIGSKIKATIFGTYANPYAQDYIDSGYKSISKENIDEMVGLDMNSTEYREYKKGLNQYGKTEEKLNYINSLDLTDNQKTLAANNLNKNSKKQIDMSEYGDYSSYNEYKYARDYPEKYSVIKQIDSYDNYEKYKDDIADIKEQYSTDNGYKSDERKSAVQSYINGLDLNMYQKMMLEHQAGGYSIKDYCNYIQEYLDSTSLTDSEKYAIWEELFN